MPSLAVFAISGYSHASALEVLRLEVLVLSTIALVSKKEKEKSAHKKGGNLKLKTNDSRGGAAVLQKIKGDNIFELSKTKEILHEHLKKVLLYLMVSLENLEGALLDGLLE